MTELRSMENGVVHYSGEFYSDDDLKDWPPISSSVALYVLCFCPSPGRYMASIILEFPGSCSISILGRRIEVKKRIYTFIMTFFVFSI